MRRKFQRRKAAGRTGDILGINEPPPGGTPPPPGGEPPEPPPPLPPPPSHRRPPEESDGGWGQAVFAAIFYLILFLVVYFTTKWSQEKWWVLALAAIACHIYLSIQQVQPNEWGALLFLGRALRQLRDGPAFAFWPLFSVVKEVRTIFQVIVGTPLTDKDGKPLPDPVDPVEGVTVLREREPFRVSFLGIEALPTEGEPLPKDPLPTELALPVVTKDMVKKYKGDPLHSALTCDPQLVFWFDIESFIDYLKTVHDVKTLSRNIAGVAKATLQECAGRITIGMLIANIDLVCQRLTYRVEQLIGESHAQAGLSRPNLYWGINFRGVQIYSSGLPRTVNVSMAENTASGYTKRKAITLAEGERQKRIDEGFGTAEAERLLREAEAIGAQKLADVAKTPEGVVVLQMKALADAVQKSNVTILPADLAQLANAVATAKALLGKK